MAEATELDLTKWGEIINDWCKPLYNEDLRRKYRYWVLKGGGGS